MKGRSDRTILRRPSNDMSRTLPEHSSSPPVFSGVRVIRSLVLCVYFVDRCLSFCSFSFGHCVVCSSSIYGFWLPPFGIFKLFLSCILENIIVVILSAEMILFTQRYVTTRGFFFKSDISYNFQWRDKWSVPFWKGSTYAKFGFNTF